MLHQELSCVRRFNTPPAERSAGFSVICARIFSMIRIIYAFSLFIILFLSSVTPSLAYFDRDLKLGSRGLAVEELQKSLGIKVDGVFGSDTLAAVNAFQVKYRSYILDYYPDLKGKGPTGYVGARTRAMLKQLDMEASFKPVVQDRSSESPLSTADIETLKSVMTPESIKALQAKLGGIPVDGEFGPLTSNRLGEEIKLGSASDASSTIASLAKQLQEDKPTVSAGGSCPVNISLPLSTRGVVGGIPDPAGSQPGTGYLTTPSAHLMNEIPSKCGCLRVSSTWRTPGHNESVGGSETSDHLYIPASYDSAGRPVGVLHPGKAIDMANKSCAYKDYRDQVILVMNRLQLGYSMSGVDQLIFTYKVDPNNPEDQKYIEQARRYGNYVEGYVYENRKLVGNEWQNLGFNRGLFNLHKSHLHVGFK